jgi:endonuclease/exonuclease/phosphatase family metal-dependent hydrolase
MNAKENATMSIHSDTTRPSQTDQPLAKADAQLTALGDFPQSCTKKAAPAGSGRPILMRTACSPTRAVRFIVTMLIAMCSVAAAASAQTTVTLSTPGTQINADLTIQGGAAGMTDFSTSDTLASKVSSESYTRRILIKVDTQNTIPANAVIQSAKLYLVLKAAESNESRPLTAFNVAQSFVKGETNWYYFRPGQAWSARGGDFAGSFGTTYVDSAVGSTYSFDLTSLVQRAVKGEFGSRYTRVALVDTGANTTGNYREFYSTRAANAAVRPRLVVTYGSASAAPAPPPAATSGTETTLRVMQWNMHKTKGSDGVCNPDRTANTIVAQQPDVVSLNEVNFFSGSCAWNFDMGQKLLSLVQQKTGATWYIQSVNPNGVGNVLLSRYRPVSSSSFILSNGRGVAQMGVVVNGRVVNIFSTHVEYDNASWRPAQIKEALAWTTNFAEPRILMGDFNTRPNTADYNLLATPYQDAWVTAKNSGVASSYNGTGATHGTSRFDYAFLSKNGSLEVNSVTVPDTVVNGVKPSDHDPVITVVTVR